VFENPAHRQELAALWKVPVDRIPDARGLAYPDIIEAALDKRIRALWIIATNPIVSFPNLGVLTQALDGLEFLVVQDGFHPTPTTGFADLVLPAAIWGEKEGTYTNSERRVSKANPACSPPGEARTDFDIFLGVAAALGVRDEIFPGWTSPRDAFDEWRRVSAGRLCDYSGMTYEAIEAHGGLQWPYPNPEPGTRNPDATRRLYADGVFQTPDGRARLVPVQWEPFPEQPTDDYPFVLNTGRTVEHWHTRTKTANVPILERLSPRAWVEMNPRDARVLRLKARDRVDVVSRRGRVSGVELRVTETIAPGEVFVPFHYAEANANAVTQSAFDPISREPNYKQSAVRVEKASNPKTQIPNPKKKPLRLGFGVWDLGFAARTLRKKGAL
jgi:assimilatory nitrate reductase catalytic subunit